jgi:hypothetical protein
MSYDLAFWKYKPGGHLDHFGAYLRLSEEEAVDEVEELPISGILDRLKVVFSEGWKRLDSTTWHSDDEESFFAVSTTPQLFMVECKGMAGEDMNKIIDVALGFGCALYDPQVGKRFDSG